ncbi:MAG: flavin reductase [Alphaproteobacteria bacterium]|nr:flavin reductase [Alphaproteobacteria bacterium]
MPAEDLTFRNAMRLLAGGVTIIATTWEGERSGLTATAVCSLALGPARVLASVNVQGLTYELVSKSRIMSVNMLAADHAGLAERFARRREGNGEDRFAGSDWRECKTGAPVLADALAALDCRVTDIVPIDSHAILIGTVEDILFGPPRQPLINFEGGFTSIAKDFPERTT